MPRLVVFGCSFVYGHGLEDCFVPPLGHGSTPSKQGWPNILAEKLGYDCVNYSYPGIGNFEILIKVLQTEFKPDDLVIIAFSYFSRFERYEMIDNLGNGEVISKNYRERSNLMEKIGRENYEAKNYWNNWLAIQHCELVLDKQNVKNHSYLGIMPANAQKIPYPNKLITLNNFWQDVNLTFTDHALDNMHPGKESHRLQAELIYSKIQNT